MTNTFVRYALSIVLGIVIALPVLGASALLTPQSVHAQPLETSDIINNDFGDTAGLGTTDIKQTIGNLIRVVLGFLGVIAVVIVLMGGFKWMTAGGNDEKVGEAKKTLIAGVIGLAIVLSAFAITQFAIGSLLGATQ